MTGHKGGLLKRTASTTACRTSIWFILPVHSYAVQSHRLNVSPSWLGCSTIYVHSRDWAQKSNRPMSPCRRASTGTGTKLDFASGPPGRGTPLGAWGVPQSSTYRDREQKSITSCRYHSFNLRSGAFLPAHSDMGEGPCVSEQPESRVVGDSGGECPGGGCRGEYTRCLLERARMLGEYMVVLCGCRSTEAGLDGTGLGVLKCLRLAGRVTEWFSLPDTVSRLSCDA